MKLFYLVPFAYFYDTRLRSGNVAFHVIFEWFAAALLVLAVSEAPPLQALKAAGLAYLAFVSLYEIGYFVNDLFASRKEADGRRRGPQGAGVGWVAVWFIARLFFFILATLMMGKLGAREWWSFFAALCLVFGMHNGSTDREFKAITFIWLAWFRFMAPVIFVVQDTQRLGIGLAAALSYVSFRLLGYLDSKGLLKMPGRQRAGIRLSFFLMPLTGALGLWHYEAAQGYLVLVGYYAFVSLVGTAANVMKNRTANRE